MFKKKVLLKPIHSTFEEPIRDEIYSSERLEQYATYLASELSVSQKRQKGISLLSRIKENHLYLIDAYKKLTQSVQSGFTISPAAEWLIDNFHVIEDQVREIKEDLPEKYYLELPKITSGSLSGYPRVYAIALSLIAHQDSHIDIETVKLFLTKYQEVSPLFIGEIWAIAITLRIGLVENLRRLSSQIVYSQQAQEWADKFADQIIELTKESDESAQSIVNEFRKKLGQSHISDCAIVVHLSKRLKNQSAKVLPVCDCIDQHLARQNLNIDHIVHTEYQRQASTQVVVGNIINSMRLLSSLDWQEFFEAVNLIDPILEQDPVQAYKFMDFSSRDRYRHAIERIQKKTGGSEIVIAKYATHFAAKAKSSQVTDFRQHHVGYYLIDKGVRHIESKIGYRSSALEILKYQILDHPTGLYLSTLFIMTVLVLSPILIYAFWQQAPWWGLVLIAIAAIIPISDSCLNLLNLVATLFLKPRILPKIDLEKVPSQKPKAFVVVPTIFSNKKTAGKLLDGLEMRYLSNQDNNLLFALLSDFTDADTQTLPKDQELIDFVKTGINDLNKKYSNGTQTFFLFHRKRLWNGSENTWMGWERKRGKIHEFNSFLRGNKNTSFIEAPKYNDSFSEIKYVITLDSDTQLPRGSARKLLGTILHPLNQPQFNSRLGRVTRGYGILQPRISITPESSERTWFARIFSGHTGIDPYTTAVSDVYQDLFGEGIYTGKGLYVIDCFEKSLEGRVPENTLLSHDLFEGLFARTSLVTDIEFLDEYPAHYEAFAKRQHRWSRGDWQILRWLFPLKDKLKNNSARNYLPFISRWKIFDNLRRSLVAIMLLIWLTLGWTVLPGPHYIWTLIAFVVIAFPFYAHATTNLLLHPRGIPWTSHFWNVFGDFQTNTAQLFLSIIFIPHQAYIQLDAIIRTLYRVYVSKKKLLEWQTAAEVESKVLKQAGVSSAILWPTLSTSLVLFLFLIYLDAKSLMSAMPFLIGWAISPIIIQRISRVRIKPKIILSSRDIEKFRNIARRTWNFFESTVNESGNWLPPDNLQEDPKHLIAHRTSPTNMGLALLSTCAAHNLGYLNPKEMTWRLGKTLDSMLKLKRRFGHFYNWYDTQKLESLHPEYISTVDSGNLAGHLISVKQICLSLLDHPIFKTNQVQGVVDTLKIAFEKFQNLRPVLKESRNINKSLITLQIQDCLNLVNPGSSFYSIIEFQKLLVELQGSIDTINLSMKKLSQEHGEEHFADILIWLEKAHQMVKSKNQQVSQVFPWTNSTLTKIDDILLNDGLENNKKIIDSLGKNKTFREQALLCKKIINCIDKIIVDKKQITDKDFLYSFKTSLEEVHRYCNDLNMGAKHLAEICNKLVLEMDFSILFNFQRKLFSIGYNVSDGKLDNSYYDLLASESRLASFIAIAKGDIPQSHWFHLGRQMTSLYRQRVLISWSASMFEYLMPLLVMKDYSNTLLNETHLAVVKQQITHCKKHGVPWGISESAYNARDLQMNYQYGPFGIPGIGLKRGLSNDTVVSPYSTALAAIVFPQEAIINFDQLVSMDLLTDFGFYEAIDFTSDRVQPGQPLAIVKSFMVHHQGMILVALDNALNNNVMQNYFHQDLMVRSSELLLQERTPKKVTISHPRVEEVHFEKRDFLEIQPQLRQIKNLNTKYPITQILSNGSYTTVLTAKGSGFSKYEDIFLTRWNEDGLLGHHGSYLFIEDDLSQSTWSTTQNPMGSHSIDYQTFFSEHKTEFWCNKENLVSHTEVIISSEDDLELKRITLTNFSQQTRQVKVTSYLEPILNALEADRAHPAFSNLFIETEYISSKSALLAHRRKRSESDPDHWGIHLITSEAKDRGSIQYETNRLNFLGRGNDISQAQVLIKRLPLSNTVGAVLDPILSLRKQVTINPGGTVRLCFISGMTSSRKDALRLIDQYQEFHVFDREEEMSWTQSQAELRHLNITSKKSEILQQLGSFLLFPCGPLRPESKTLLANTKSQSALWAYGISGDFPILTVKIRSSHEIALIKELLQAHEYLRLKNIKFDLVILNAESSSYRLSLQEELMHQIRVAGEQALLNKHGGIFLLREDSVPQEDYRLLQSAAKVFLDSQTGHLKEQVLHLNLKFKKIAEPPSKKSNLNRPWKNIPLNVPERLFENGFGGFSLDGKEYVILLKQQDVTPAPWCNVIANDQGFGFLVTERGSSCTWFENSRENRLTPWSNDPITDPSGEIIYLQDKESNIIWSLTPAPKKGPEAYMIRHGQGYSHFENNNYDIRQKLTMFCSIEDNIKINRVTLKNESEQPRKLSLTYYLELVLGYHRSNTAHHIVTKPGSEPNVLLARNVYNEDFGHNITFMAANEAFSSFTCDRSSFFKGAKDYKNPEGLFKPHLNQKYGAGLDPCFVVKIDFQLQPQEEKELFFIFGQALNSDQVESIVEKYYHKDAIRSQFDKVIDYWNYILGVLQIKTPFPEFDILINRWLLYQNLSCRIWARTAFYQSGGAYGFRDQLQDVTALLHSAPQIARQQILLAAANQFEQGDVLHWWHPPSNKGVRTHFSDDRLWLPYVVCIYIEATGDNTILDEKINFIKGPDLPQDKEDLYFQPEVSNETASLYEHCIRAINRSLKVGSHRLPLIGTGDWNDGMNQIGAKGRGESVWMAWFLISTLKSFTRLCEKKKDEEHLKKYNDYIKRLYDAVETNGWDGNWYRRAFFDDGQVLGSKQNDECKIDSITQSWAVLSGEANVERCSKALASLTKYLVKEDQKMILLFTPPFDKTEMNPGYIKGYVPGVRENGGQYTHAAIWTVMAFAANKDGDFAFKLMSMLNPINHSLSKQQASIYKVEPYVISADIYMAPNYIGQGGWTWYTGSAGWFYRAFTESILGIYREGNTLNIRPCLPELITEYQFNYKFGSTNYSFHIFNSKKAGKALRLTLDGKKSDSSKIQLVDDGAKHHIKLEV